ncbi:MAG: hypothetical protein ACFB4J_08015 [Elainellaceae cyanobacterium]
MTYNNSTRASADQTVALGLAAAFATFVVGYTMSRAYLANSPAADATTEDAVIVTPHQAALWAGFGPTR